ncbi:MAG: hypothetical protein LC750_00520 [Actinobacteria bacterium]|nr:hypothetical protein [Actinomycetota bacterium]
MSFTLANINAALTRTGNDPLTTLEGGSPAQKIATANYELIVKELLCAYPWRWATKAKTLVMLDGTPDLPWAYAYQIPNDILHIRVATVSGYPLDYERQGNKLLCNAGNTQDVVLIYTYSVEESLWPQTFAEAVIQRMEAVFLRGIGERYQEADEREKSAKVQLQQAKREDAKGRSPRDVWTHPLLAARGGITAYPPIPYR